MDERSARLANNEAVFRAGNEAIAANRGRTGTAEAQEFLCECGNDRCFEQVALTPKEYELIRAEPARFFVVAGHEDLTAGEIVVATSDRYVIVEKQGDGRRVVERSDPEVDVSGNQVEALEKNEALFRRVNERIESISDQVPREESAMEFVCECDQAGCFEKVAATRAEYESVRAVATHFLVAPGHVDPEVEHVVFAGERFSVVEKEGLAARDARRDDPRS